MRLVSRCAEVLILLREEVQLLAIGAESELRRMIDQLHRHVVFTHSAQQVAESRYKRISRSSLRLAEAGTVHILAPLREQR